MPENKQMSENKQIKFRLGVIGVFLLGIIMGALINSAIHDISWITHKYQLEDFIILTKNEIKKCEKSLPRDQNCKIIITAEPMEKKNGDQNN